MKILDNLIIIILLMLAFYAGKKTSDNYNTSIIEELRYVIRMNAAERGVGYVAPPVRRRRNVLGQEFMDKLRQNGKATQQIDNT